MSVTVAETCIYPKYLDTLITYQTYPKSWKSI